MHQVICLFRIRPAGRNTPRASRGGRIDRPILSPVQGKLDAISGYDAAAAGRITDSLVQDRYVSDVRYASAFAREKASLQGWGPVKIRFQLRGKGISEADITAALQEIDAADASNKLERLLTAKARSLQGDPQFRLKLIKYALSRGYEYDAVETALERIQLIASQS